MGLFENLIGSYFGKRDLKYDEITGLMKEQISYMKDVLGEEGYIKRSFYRNHLEELYSVLARAEKQNNRLIMFSSEEIRAFKTVYDDFYPQAVSFEGNIELHNAAFLQGAIAKTRSVIGKIEGHDLDDQQLMCIAKESHNHSVIAGAGTGKTTTIIGKVKYLVNTKKYLPEDILVLSYTRAAAMEMKERLKRNVNANVSVSTFHHFGYQIMTQVEHKKPIIISTPMEKILRSRLNELMRDPVYTRLLITFIGSGNGVIKSDLDHSFQNIDEYYDYMNSHRPVTLKGETVKSFGEMHLANILAQNGVKYTYEKHYQVDTATEEYAQYTPDFYLDDYGIYIEYFGIDRNGKAPDWFEGEDPTKTYQQGMAWKRNTHRKFHTTMIECYAYEDAEGILQQELERKLTAAGVQLRSVSLQELFARENDRLENILSAFIRTASAIINLARNKRISADRLVGYANTLDTKLIAQLIMPLQKAYEEELKSTNTIDFADMLNDAEEYIMNGQFENPFKYIIVDEYQDITASQYRLLTALRASRDFELFCVGDDWQSIYRFNGSDVGYIMEFERFWGDAEISRIETTYRFPQSLIDVSSQFVMCNPRQIKKSIRSGVKDEGFAVSIIEGYREAEIIRQMGDTLLQLPKNSTVFLLGRYNFDSRLLEHDFRFEQKFDTATQTVKVVFRNRKDLIITFYTAHRSKGLQADYVFILNNTSGVLGFPSSIEDNPLTELLLDSKDIYPNAEERRLFYVALTRARHHVYLLSVKNKESVFFSELAATYKGIIKNVMYVCPKCGGKLRLIEGPYGKFFGCSNYKVNGCTYKRAIKSGNEVTQLKGMGKAWKIT